MKNKWMLFILTLLVLGSCKKMNTDFTFTPTSPKAGEKVTFINTSSGGEEWEWTFGDNFTSSSKSPTHTYQKAGTYTVTLCAQYKKQRRYATAVITVVDSIPSFAASTDSICYYKPVRFHAQTWNPFDHSTSYLWSIDENAVLLSSRLDSSSIEVYFTQHSKNARISLETTKNGEKTVVEKSFYIHDSKAHSLLVQTPTSYLCQRLYGDLAEPLHAIDYEEGKNLLKIAQDTLQVYGDSIFRLSSLNIAGHTIEGFLIDRTARKIYFRDNGLYVSNINGSHIVCICPDKTTAICIDGGGNRIYWSTSQGVWRMPLVQTENNQFTYIPKLVNSQKDIIKIAIDNTLR